MYVVLPRGEGRVGVDLGVLDSDLRISGSRQFRGGAGAAGLKSNVGYC
ncbi:MAG: hypothetical protein OXI01_10020 [Albidovulum sp.]|nr:hypothetical protein [Albidovulum sp.]